MKKIYGNVVLITGASSGIGKSLAEFFMKEGCRVYGTSRKHQPVNEEKYITDKEGINGFIKMIQLDVCSEQSVKEAVDYVLKEEGTIDILVNNAGFGIAGSVEDTSIEESQKQFDTNFFGVMRMCRSVLPLMRAKKKGLIINIGSVAGLISIPYQSMYCASKFALEALTEVLRIEVKDFGIKVVLVEPGDTRTGFTHSRQFTSQSVERSVYWTRFTKAIKTMINDERNGPGPEVVVSAVAGIIKRKNPPIRVIVGFSYKLIVLMKRILPSRLVEYVVSKMY